LFIFIRKLKFVEKQNPSVMNASLASFGQRLLAYLIDALPITLIVAAIFYFFFGFDALLHNYLERAPNDLEARKAFMSQRTLIRNISFLLYVVYAAFMESSPSQGTLGKRALGLSVGGYTGQRLSLKASFIRNFGKLISISVFALGFLWVLFDKNRQGWHDKMAKTLVVKK
jgi:uncharacterized RDD family membrane protein YckC